RNRRWVSDWSSDVCSSDLALLDRSFSQVKWEGGDCPACVNHDAETAFVRRCAAMVLGEAAVEEGEPAMPSDDMSLFLRERPGCRSEERRVGKEGGGRGVPE